MYIVANIVNNNNINDFNHNNYSLYHDYSIKNSATVPQNSICCGAINQYVTVAYYTAASTNTARSKLLNDRKKAKIQRI
jgi:hypothetical protein